MKSETIYDIIVIGGGVSGLIAAGRAGELGAKVLLLEKMGQTGRKLLITGKGRCNITNDSNISDFFKHIHPNPRFLKHAFFEFFTSDIIGLLKKYGVETEVERGERVFPISNSSADVHKALLQFALDQKVEIRCGIKASKLLIENNTISGIQVIENNVTGNYFAKKIIICTGGNSYPATGSDGQAYKMIKEAGHKIEAVRPSLVPLETEGDLAEKLQGLSLKNVSAKVWVNGKKQKEEFGEMLFTHFGLSGPIILTLSRFVVDEIRKHSDIEISIDLKPALDENKLDIRLQRDLNESGKKQLQNVFREWLPSKMIPVFFELTGINPYKECHQVNAKERKKILFLMKDFRLIIKGHRSFKEAIITAGGVCTNEIDAKSMESKLIKNLYFAGEVIDLDADTGGYNLQIAYSTAWLAGSSAAC